MEPDELNNLRRNNPHVAIIGCGGEGRRLSTLAEIQQYLIDNPREAKTFNQCFNCWMCGFCSFDSEKYEDEEGMCTKYETQAQHTKKLIESMSMAITREAGFIAPKKKGYQYEGYNRAARRGQKSSGKWKHR